ncbi:hypothetical protein LguiA_017447 [Lonicera macranthoides]
MVWLGVERVKVNWRFVPLISERLNWVLSSEFLFINKVHSFHVEDPVRVCTLHPSVFFSYFSCYLFIAFFIAF